MIKDNQRVFNRLLVIVDILITAIAMPMAYFTKFRIISPHVTGNLPFSNYINLMYFVIPIYVIIYFLSNVYDPKRTTRIKHECYTIFKANTVGMVLLILAIFIVLKEINYSRSVLAFFFIFNTCGTMCFRFVLRKLIRYARKNGYNQKHILLIGYSQSAEAFIDRIAGNPQWGYAAYGILDNRKEAGYEYRGVKVIGPLSDLTELLAANDLDEVAITLSLEDYDYLERAVNECEKQGIHTQFVPDYGKLISSNAYTEDLYGLPVVNIRYVPLSNGGNAAIKRLVDIVLSFVGIIIASPLMLIIAILVKCTSKGPVIFKQERIGLHNKPFNMYKFRSMRVQTDEEEKDKWTTKGDPRVTPIGRFIRGTSIDELPQLFNILIGDMSIVGPRPERPQFVEQFKETIPRYMIKHQVRPGLTGWAQVNGLRGDTSIEKRIEYDIYYIEHWKLTFDFKIMFLTLFTGFINRNAY